MERGQRRVVSCRGHRGHIQNPPWPAPPGPHRAPARPVAAVAGVWRHAGERRRLAVPDRAGPRHPDRQRRRRDRPDAGNGAQDGVGFRHVGCGVSADFPGGHLPPFLHAPDRDPGLFPGGPVPGPAEAGPQGRDGPGDPDAGARQVMGSRQDLVPGFVGGRSARTSPNLARIPASTLSVFANSPVALAKSRACRGVVTRTPGPRSASDRCIRQWNRPVASTTTRPTLCCMGNFPSRTKPSLSLANRPPVPPTRMSMKRLPISNPATAIAGPLLLFSRLTPIYPSIHPGRGDNGRAGRPSFPTDPDPEGVRNRGRYGPTRPGGERTSPPPFPAAPERDPCAVSHGIGHVKRKAVHRFPPNNNCQQSLSGLSWKKTYERRRPAPTDRERTAGNGGKAAAPGAGARTCTAAGPGSPLSVRRRGRNTGAGRRTPFVTLCSTPGRSPGSGRHPACGAAAAGGREGARTVRARRARPGDHAVPSVPVDQGGRHGAADDIGPDISARRAMRFPTDGAGAVADEQREVLRVGMETGRWTTVDDTGARHRAVNGYCTVVGNDVFTHFRSTGPKGRPTFPDHLRVGDRTYTVNDAAPGLMRRMKLPGRALSRLMSHRRRFADGDEWRAHPAEPGIDRMKGKPDPLGVATEGAVRSTIAGAGRIAGTVVTGDDAGHFNVGDAHAPVRVHAERTVRKKRGSDEFRRTRVDAVPDDVRDLYRDLSDCRQAPRDGRRRKLSARFDRIFGRRTVCTDIDGPLWRLSQNRDELPPVLDWPATPLHTNGAERDIRAQVTRRKIPFGTRSGDGRVARDACPGAMKTCVRACVSFRACLRDRIGVAGASDVSGLADLVRRSVPA